MPQMKPMNWLLLLYIFLMIHIIFLIIMNNMSYMLNIKVSKNKNTIISKIHKW